MTNNWPLIIEAEQLRAALPCDEFLILDTSSTENYLRQHVPGAIHIPPASLQAGQKPAPGKLPSVEQLTQLFSAAGLSPDKHVIAYDDEGGGWAGRLIWTLDVIGHKKYSYLNGGIHAWANEGHPCESTTNTPAPTTVDIEIDDSVMVSVEEIKSRIGEPNFAIWDARSAQEYNGEKVLAARGGHIPGAVNIDWLDLIDRENNMRFKDLAALRQRLLEKSLSSDKNIITHCQTHHRSGLSYLLMKILGYPNIRGYDGSWGEWGNLSDTPINTGTTP
ncbi:MAG: sulfurtransferase [Spongiibacteraceae bacterium]